MKFSYAMSKDIVRVFISLVSNAFLLFGNVDKSYGARIKNVLLDNLKGKYGPTDVFSNQKVLTCFVLNYRNYILKIDILKLKSAIFVMT